MEALLDVLPDTLKNNQIFSGGAVLMALGFVAALARSLPLKLWTFVKRRFVVELDVTDSEETYGWITSWLAAQPYCRDKARNLSVKTYRPDGRDDTQPEIDFTAAPGLHFLWFRRRLLLLERIRKEGDKDYSALRRESYKVRLITRNRKLMRTFLEECREIYCPRDEQRISVWVGDYGRWEFLHKRLPRTLDSVVWPAGELEALVADMRVFLTSKKRYADLCMPWRKGYLFKGPPGSGKTSAIIAVASELKLDLYLLDLSNPSITDATLRTLFSSVPQNSIVLMEDATSAIEAREKNDQKTLTMSGLLNAIDGVCSGEGRFLIMTTNYAEKLAPELIRPGRIDKQIEVPNAKRCQAVRMFDRFFPQADPTVRSQFEESVPEQVFSMAFLQGVMIANENDPAKVTDAVIAERLIAEVKRQADLSVSDEVEVDNGSKVA